MSMVGLLQTTPLERLELLRQQFNRGASWEELLTPLFLVIAGVALVAAIYTAQRRRPTGSKLDPRGVYRRLLRGLGLPAGERDVLLRMATGLQTENPTVVLLGPALFRAHSQAWLNQGRHVRRGDAERLAAAARRLFPTHRTG